MPDPQIFKATYSGIPVYEMMCKGVAVMRRRADSWLNATQILKVAGYDKPQRTRVLEREVQKGEHEKVQGGYGKYQGTWIPLERGIELAQQYHCEHLLRPIIDFTPAAQSPPPAPRHAVASAGPRGGRRGTDQDAPSAATTISTRSRRQIPHDIESDHETLTDRGSDNTMTPSPSEASSSSRTPSPIRHTDPKYTSNGINSRQAGGDATGARRNKYRRSLNDAFTDSDGESPSAMNGVDAARVYGDQILEYFISDTNQIPQVLISPPPDFDPNMAIDDDGHTALHWACAMGRIRVVKLLLSAGADVFNVNKAGQTALMRSVMFANNYDVRKFPELYELLHRTTLNIDNYNRTVFHHVVDVAMSKGKTHAARYYMETILTRLSEYPKELADVMNFQDEDGETALTMAARCRSKRLVKLLIDHGADPKLINNDGKSTEDYILEDERFRSSPVPSSRLNAMSYRNAQAAYSSHGSSYYSGGLAQAELPPLHHSAAAQRASTRCVSDMTTMFDSLAASFDQELRDKERDMTQAHALLANIQAEILESQRSVTHLRAQAEGLGQTKQTLMDLETKLLDKMGKRYRMGWEKWVTDEQIREKAVRDGANGDLKSVSSPEEKAFDELTADGAANMGKKRTQDTDISDLISLHSNIPPTSDAIRQACGALREEIIHQRKRRKVLFEELVKFQAEAGTSDRMGEYRRLIGAGCGGIPPAEVDEVLSMLLETLESEEPSSASAWGGSKAGS